jgi:hypothetical protein
MVGWRQIRWRAGLLLFTFLGVFSLGMLTPWRGLLLTGGGLLLLGIFMLLYARRPLEPEPEPGLPPVATVPEPEPDSAPVEAISEPEPDSAPVATLDPEPAPTPVEAVVEPPQHHCPYCARTLGDDYSFCPGCGHDTSQVHRCAACGQEQFIPAELEPAYCLSCGQVLS